jgi:putative transposase
LTGPGGFLPEMVEAVLERGLQAELTQHLGHEPHQRSHSGNIRNGVTSKTLACEVGDIALDTPQGPGRHVHPETCP